MTAVPTQEQRSLRRQLMRTVLFAVLPVSVVGVIMLVTQYTARRDLLLHTNLTQAHLAASYVQGWVTGNARVLAVMATSDEVRSGSSARIRDLFRSAQEVEPEWGRIFLTDASGQERAGTSAELPNVQDREYFRLTRQTLRPVASNLLVSRATGKYIIVIASPVIRNGRFQGILAASISPTVIAQVFSQVPGKDQTTISLWGSDHVLIARSSLSPARVGRKYHTRLSQRIFSGEDGTLIGQSPVTGQRLLIGYTPVPQTPWVVISASPVRVAFAPLFRSGLILLAVLLLTTTVVLVWTLRSTAQISLQVERLAQSAQRIGEGDFATPVTMPDGNELACIATALNQLATALRSSEHVKSDVLNMISHELKTPLTSIRTSLDLLQASPCMQGEAQALSLWEIADRQTRHLATMIENLLNAARLQTGSLAVLPHATDLVPLIRDVAAQSEEAIRQRNLALTVSVPASLMVLADAPRISLVISNLLDNAVKFTNTGGITITASSQEGMAHIAIRDTGIGMDDDLQQRLFNPFVQAEELMTRHIGGAGLGLLVSKAIIEAHGGQIWVESAVDNGSTFSFTLPLVNA